MATDGGRGRVVLIRQPQDNQFSDVLDAAADAYASGFAAHGLATQSLHPSAPGYADEVPRLARDPGVVAFFSVGGKGLLLAPPGDGAPVTPFAGVEKPVICQHGDHPFQWWVARALRLDIPGRIAFFNDPASVRLVERWGLDRGGRTFHSPPALLGADRPRPTGPRDIPMLYVGLLDNPAGERSLLASRHPSLTGEFDAVVERALDDYTRPLIEIVEAVLAERGRRLEQVAAALDLLNHVDWYIRHERRRRMLAKAWRRPMLIVAQKPMRLVGMHPRARVLGRQPLGTVLALCERARIMLLPQPPYPGGLTERILYAMDRGCAVVATPSPALEHHFTPGRDLLTVAPDLADVEARIDELRDERRRAEMAERARAIVRRDFMPATIVAGYLARLRELGHTV